MAVVLGSTLGSGRRAQATTPQAASNMATMGDQGNEGRDFMLASPRE
jgi:hypothetical protein